MAVEEARGCGYRKVGGMYLVCDAEFTKCDRQNIPICVCPTCGHGVKFARGITWIIPGNLFQPHQEEIEAKANGGKFRRGCTCGPCHLCQPSKEEKAALMWVGEKYYTPAEFVKEAQTLGISKRIGQAVPQGLELGKTVVYLAHRKAAMVPSPEEGFFEPGPGIFLAFVPQRIEKIYKESDRDSEEVQRDEKRGITPVFVPDEDKDHQ